MIALMFEVTAIRRHRLTSNIVELQAIEEMRGTKTLLAGVRSIVGRCPYHFPVGSKLSLTFAPWRRFRVGDRVELSMVLNHPTVQETIWRGDTSTVI